MEMYMAQCPECGEGGGVYATDEEARAWLVSHLTSVDQYEHAEAAAAFQQWRGKLHLA